MNKIGDYYFGKRMYKQIGPSVQPNKKYNKNEENEIMKIILRVQNDNNLHGCMCMEYIPKNLVGQNKIQKEQKKNRRNYGNNI